MRKACRLCNDRVEEDDLQDVVTPEGVPVATACPSCVSLLVTGFLAALKEVRKARFEQMNPASKCPAGYMKWLKPKAIKSMPQYHSNSMNVVPILLYFTGDKHARIGRYIATPHTMQFRLEGSPNAWLPDLWRPMPGVPPPKGKPRRKS